MRYATEEEWVHPQLRTLLLVPCGRVYLTVRVEVALRI